MLRRILVAVLLTACSTAAFARGSFFGYVQKGGTASVGGFTSSNSVQKAYPGATVTIFNTGTSTKPTLYSNATGTALANPFTANSDASFQFYAEDGVYDITFSGAGITTSCGSSTPGYPCIATFTWSYIAISGSSSATTYTPVGFGAACDGTTNDAAALNSMFSAVASNAGGIVQFPTAKTCMTAYGFILPSNTSVYLNGSTLKATTTFGQGSIGSQGTGIALLRIGSTSTGTTTTNVRIYGGGGTLDGNILNQTGSVSTYDALLFRIATASAAADKNAITNVYVDNITLTNASYDGVEIGNTKGAEFVGITASYNGRHGQVINFGGTDIRFRNCHFDSNRGLNNIAQGGISSGVWNEPNSLADASISALDNIEYNECSASYNYNDGFHLYNSGQNSKTNIRANNCFAYSNVWDWALNAGAGGYRAGILSYAGFTVQTSTAALTDFKVSMIGCVAQKNGSSGFLVQRGTGGSGGQISLIAPLSIDNNGLAAGGGTYLSAYISVGGQGTNNTDITSARIVTTSGEATTSGLGVFRSGGDVTTNVFITDPVVYGTFTNGAVVVGTAFPGSRLSSGALVAMLTDAPWNAGATGGHAQFFKPVKPARIDSTTDPNASLVINEFGLWRDTSVTPNRLYQVFKSSDSTLFYIRMGATQGVSTTLSAVAFANLGAPDSGAISYCTDCDPPAAEGNACASAGAKTGAEAHYIRGAWKCFGH